MQGKRSVAGYMRVSTAMQGESGLSLDNQRHRIEGFVAARSLDDRPLRWYEDVASAASIDRRHGLRQLLQDIDAGIVGMVVVTKLDRLVRSPLDYHETARRLKASHCRIAACDGSIDLSNPYGEAWAAMQAVFAKLERDLISMRTTEAAAELRRQGRRAGTTPYGYAADADGRLVPHAGEQAALALMRAEWRDGHSLGDIGRMLEAAGHFNRSGRPHTRQAISRLLREHPE